METGGNVAERPIIFSPGVGSAYGNGWRQLWKYFPVLLLIGIIYIIISCIIQIPQFTIWFSSGFNFTSLESSYFMTTAFSIIVVLFNIFIVSPVGYGQYFAYLRAARGEEVEVRDMFTAFQNYWNAVGANILVIIITGVGPAIAFALIALGISNNEWGGVLAFFGFILLLILGILSIIFTCKLAFVPYIVVDRKMGAWKAVKESWRLSDGHAGQVFLIFLLGIPIVIAGLICLLIGVIISYMWIFMALASLYYSVTAPWEEPVAQPSPISQ